MKRKSIATLSIVVVLLISMFGTVFAQSGDGPTEPPTSTEEPAGAKFFTHPVVQVLSLYFDREVTDETTDEPIGDDPTVTPTEPSESGLGPIGEQIAAFHEDGMGFGVLVKIYAMAEAAKTACPDMPVVEGDTPVEPTCTAVSPEELVEQFKAGGMGALFKQYGKPALLGVGHVKKALKNQPADPDALVTVEAKGNGKPPKVHTNNGNGKGNNK